MAKDYKLLEYHMNCNPDYIEGHAIIAGNLAQGKYTTFEEYKRDCNRYGITYYNEELFNKFMNIEPITP